MSEECLSVLSSILGGMGGGLVLSIAVYLFRDWFAMRLKASIEQHAEIRRSRYELKREACLEALSVIDSSYSQHNWNQDGKKIIADEQPLDVIKARECYNKLALTCDNPSILERYLDALGVETPMNGAKQVFGDAIVDVRELMRQELGFGTALDLPREKAWIANLNR